jgi:hypothetical protein
VEKVHRVGQMVLDKHPLGIAGDALGGGTIEVTGGEFESV